MSNSLGDMNNKMKFKLYSLSNLNFVSLVTDMTH